MVRVPGVTSARFSLAQASGVAVGSGVVCGAGPIVGATDGAGVAAPEHAETTNTKVTSALIRNLAFTMPSLDWTLIGRECTRTTPQDRQIVPGIPKRRLEEVRRRFGEDSRRWEEVHHREDGFDWVLPVGSQCGCRFGEPAGPAQFPQEEELVHFGKPPGLLADVDPAQERRQVGRLIGREAPQEQSPIGRPSLDGRRLRCDERASGGRSRPDPGGHREHRH